MLKISWMHTRLPSRSLQRGAAIACIALAGIPGTSFASPLPIQLTGRTILTAITPSLPSQLAGTEEHRYLLAQFASLPTPEQISAAGLRSVAYVDAHTIMIHVPSESSAIQLSSLSPSWVGTVDASDRLASSAVDLLTSVLPDAPLQMLVAGYQGVPQSDMAALIARHGGSIQPRAGLPGHVALVSATASGFRAIAEEDAIAKITAAPAFVLQGQVGIAWCDGGGTAYGPMPSFVVHDSGWDGPGLGSAHDLRIRLRNTTRDLGTTTLRAVQEQVFVAAFSEWARYADLCAQLTTLDNQPRTIEVTFTNGMLPSEGANSAFGYGPYNGEPLSGDIHMDENKSWSLAPAGFQQHDLFAFALHEIGHTLGLTHTQDSRRLAVMHDATPTGIPWLHTLATDDINGIRQIYKTRQVATTPAGDLGCILPVQF